MTAPPSFSTPPMPDRMLPPMDMARADVGHDACEDLGRLQQCETNIEQAKRDSQTAARKEAALTVNANAATEVEELMNQRHSAEGSTLTQALYKAAVGHAAEEHRLAAQAAQWHREAKASQGTARGCTRNCTRQQGVTGSDGSRRCGAVGADTRGGEAGQDCV